MPCANVTDAANPTKIAAKAYRHTSFKQSVNVTLPKYPADCTSVARLNNPVSQ